MGDKSPKNKDKKKKQSKNKGQKKEKQESVVSTALHPDKQPVKSHKE